MPSIYWLITQTHCGNITNWFITAFHKYIISINQVAIDVADNLWPSVGINRTGCVIGSKAETNNHTMHMRLAAGFAVPTECTVRKVNVYTHFKQRLP